PPVEPVVEPPLSEDPFDEFEYEDEALDEAEGYYTEEGLDDEPFENPWRNQQGSPAYTFNIEELTTQDPNLEDAPPVEDRLEGSLKDVPLDPHGKEKALGMLLVEKDIFARD
ncbi:17235_t:CDS:1, partial [Dentiscutata heterogama]